MDDLMSKLQGILSTKEGQEQLKNLQSMFGGMSSAPQQEPPPQQQQATSSQGGFDFSAIASMLSGLGGNTGSQETNSAPNSEPLQNGMPNIDIGMIMKLQQAFSSMNTNDKNSQLLLALKPHFSEKRSKKVDQAINLMRLYSMLPMLKESGILQGLTGMIGL